MSEIVVSPKNVIQDIDMSTPFTSKVKNLIKQIPEGKVISYGLIAAIAGNPQAARQVARILHACSRKDNLPWHRVVNRNGQISLKPYNGYEAQKHRLEREGVVFTENDIIDFDIYLWLPENVSQKIRRMKRSVYD